MSTIARQMLDEDRRTLLTQPQVGTPRPFRPGARRPRRRAGDLLIGRRAAAASHAGNPRVASSPLPWHPHGRSRDHRRHRRNPVQAFARSARAAAAYLRHLLRVGDGWRGSLPVRERLSRVVGRAVRRQRPHSVQSSVQDLLPGEIVSFATPNFSLFSRSSSRVALRVSLWKNTVGPGDDVKCFPSGRKLRKP